MRPPRNTDQCITARTNAITWFTTRFRGNHCNFGIRSNVGSTLYAAVGALFHMCMCLHKYYHGTRSCARSACMHVFMLGRSFAPSVCARLASRNVTEKQQNMTLTNVQVMRVRTEYALHIVQKRVVQERPCGETIILHCLFRVFNE